MSQRSASSGRTWLGILLILVGGIIFLKNFHFNLFHIDLLSWPFIAFIVGFIILVNHKESFFGLLLIIVGIIGLTSRYLNISFRGVISEYWPFLLIIFGLYTIFMAFGKDSGNLETIEVNGNQLDIFSLFGSRSNMIKSEKFSGGKTTSIFSELKVDLRNCILKQSTTILDTITIFGSTEITLPPDWEVIIKTTTIFGGFDDQRVKSFKQVEEMSDKILVIKGLVLFGGGEIKG